MNSEPIQTKDPTNPEKQPEVQAAGENVQPRFESVLPSPPAPPAPCTGTCQNCRKAEAPDQQV